MAYGEIRHRTRSCAANCATTWSGPCRRSPSSPVGELTLTALSGGITNRNFLVASAGRRDRYVIRLAGNDTHLLGISREVEHAATVAAAGVGVGPEVTAFIRPGGLPRHPLHRGLADQRGGVHEPETLDRVAASLRRIHDGPAIPGLFVPLRIVEAYRALALARGVRIPPEYELAAAIGRRIELACLANPVELRPCHNDLLNANFIDDGVRIRIVDWEYAGMGDPFFDLGNFSINHELTPDEDALLLARLRRRRRPPRPARPADPDADRVRLPRGDVGRPPAGDQHARRRFRRVCRRALRSTARERDDAGVRARPARGGRRRAGSMARRGAVVGEQILRGDERPVEGPLVQDEPEHAVGQGHAELAVWTRCPERGRGAPPVPTTNSRRPRSRSARPAGSCGAKRS